MIKPKPLPKTAANDRRRGDDRRLVEGQPPGKHDRRRHVEPRKPEVVELEMSSSEWAALNGLPPPRK
jgi:hypothetical protein